MKNENLKNAIVKAVEEVLDSINHAKDELEAKNISVHDSRDIHFEVPFNLHGTINEGTIKFSIKAYSPQDDRLGVSVDIY